MPSPSEPGNRKWLLVAVGLVVVLAGVATFVVLNRDADDEPATGAPTAAASSDSDESWLLSLTARSGSMVEQPDGTFLLTLEHTDEDVTAFTDRPDRDAKVVPASALVDEWSNVFADSPPNAVLVEHDPVGATDSWVVELTEPTLDGSTMTFTAAILQEEDHDDSAGRLTNEVYDAPPAQFRVVSLFIDDVDSGSAANKSKFKVTLAA